MKSRFFLLIAVVSSVCLFSSAKAQETVAIQKINGEIQQSLLYSSNLSLSHLSLSNSVNQSSFDD